MRYDLTDFEWSVIEPLLPSRTLAWEDLEAGGAIVLRDMVLSRRKVAAFAANYALQPFHMREGRGWAHAPW